MKFTDIHGHEELKRRLAAAVDEGRVSHAQLFTGESGTGALPLALAYAQYVNCEARAEGDSCGECASCRKMAELAHPDLHFVFPVNSATKSGSQKPSSDAFLTQWRALWAETDGIFDEAAWYSTIDIENRQGLITRGEADEVIRKLAFKSFEARYKVVIVWLPEKMRAEAANALLKILEEPWERTLFLLVSAAPEQLLPTIVSRTQHIAVSGVEAEAVERYLLTHFGMTCGGEAQGLGLTQEEAADIARIAGGDLIEARRLAAAAGDEDVQHDFELFAALMRLSYNDRHMELIEWAEGVAAMGREQQKRFLRYAVRMLRENYMLNAGMENITALHGAELDFSRKFSPYIGNHNIEPLVAEMELALLQITRNGNPKMIFTHFALVVSKLIVKV
ncbi:MAG: DNA polymerase III subunit [Rikenellaceae bacterium]|nr:DNA polymerase III subunit [Rikenellaceae bacterium]MCL2693443.1 DNA polymerase III subunit [Rikenellaceae bacterium]